MLKEGVGNMANIEETIDWDRYWDGDIAEFDVWSYEIGSDIASAFTQLFESTSVPETVASVGCGPATMLLDLADSYPGSQFYGYDIAPSVIEQARERRDKNALNNAQFHVDGLPYLNTDDTFEFVYSITTLHYVAEVEAAVESLWKHVDPGGALLLNYPTPSHADGWARKLVDEWDDVGFESKSQKWVRERMNPVLEGESTLTAERIGTLLGREPYDIRDADVELPEEVQNGFPMTLIYR